MKCHSNCPQKEQFELFLRKHKTNIFKGCLPEMKISVRQLRLTDGRGVKGTDGGFLM